MIKVIKNAHEAICFYIGFKGYPRRGVRSAFNQAAIDDGYDIARELATAHQLNAELMRRNNLLEATLAEIKELL